MTNKTSRRAVLAGAAALPALAIPTAALALTAPDPIFAAIERHKVAFRVSQEKGQIRAEVVDAEWAPEYNPVECNAALDADEIATDHANDAADALTTIQPTTIAGLLALMHYVEAFNSGAFVLDSDPYNWSSGPMQWPGDVEDDEADLFGYSILANVRSALEAMAVRS